MRIERVFLFIIKIQYLRCEDQFAPWTQAMLGHDGGVKISEESSEKLI